MLNANFNANHFNYLLDTVTIPRVIVADRLWIMYSLADVIGYSVMGDVREVIKQRLQLIDVNAHNILGCRSCGAWSLIANTYIQNGDILRNMSWNHHFRKGTRLPRLCYNVKL